VVSVRDENGGVPGGERRPFGTVVASAVDGFRALAREHVELLKLDVSEAASVRGRGVGMIGAAIVVAMYAVGFVAAAGAAGARLVDADVGGNPDRCSSVGRGRGTVGPDRASRLPNGTARGRADQGDLEGGCSVGEATDRKVTEIDETRRRLAADLRELEARIPSPLRSTKSLVGLILGSSALTALVVRRLRSARSSQPASAEVVIRIVRDDE
jgi:hypothetical protein